jgi:hypothetical protein
MKLADINYPELRRVMSLVRPAKPLSAPEAQIQVASGLHDYHERFFKDFLPEMKADFYRWKNGDQ